MLLESLEPRTLLSVSLFVDDSNATGMADGSATKPFSTIQAAVDAAAAVPDDAIIRVAQGTYSENVVLPDKSVQLLGGFAGGTASAYANGQPGDFAAATPSVNVTNIAGASGAPVLALNNLTAQTFVIDGFSIRGGLHGVYCSANPPQFANVTIAHNIIENNGPAQLQPDGGTYDNRGGGIYASNATITVTNNVLRNNNANRGGGMFIASQSGFTVADNLIENNSGYDDHGGGVVLNPLPVSAAGNATFSRNVVRGNVAAKAFNYGYAGGVLIPGNLDPAGLKPVTLSNNTYTGNSAPSFGGAIFVDNGATVVLDHELVYKNNTTRADDGGAGGIYLDGDAGGPGTPPSGSFLTIQNSTIADNTSGTQVGNGVVVQENSRLTVTNSIFWGNTDDFSVDDTSTIAVTYTDSQEATPGVGNLSTDPLFANPATGDYHLKSTAGRFDPTAQGGAGGFVLDAVNSPAVDAGDPASPFANETAPNGGRINLGFEGNTAEASRSASANPAAPTITGLNPGSGPAAGNTSVIISGTNFTAATGVSFGGTAALNFVVNSAMQITATSPAHAAGTVDVTVTNAGGTSATGQPDQYVYTAPGPTPRVTGLNPSNGPDAGGTSVTITGQNFTGATAVSFGGTAASSLVVNSSTQITATAPAHTAGTVDVTVTTAAGTSATESGDQYLYTSPPSPTPPAVTGLNPATGSTNGGTSVTVTGQNFAAVTAVSFGGTPATSFVVNSTTQITATAPAHAAGTVDVTVTTAAGISTGGSPDQYVYTSPTLPSGTLAFGVGSLNANEGTTATVTVVRTGGSSGTVFVQFVVSVPGTLALKNQATPGTDFQGPLSGTLTFQDGETQKTVSLPVPADDLVEDTEFFTFALQSPGGGATLGALTTITVGILDADAPVVPDATPKLSTLQLAGSGFGKSEEHYKDFVTKAYSRYLNRLPDAQGFTYWVGLMQLYETSGHKQGLRQEQLEAGFLDSVEYLGRNGGVAGAGGPAQPETWVRAIYRDLLSRGADPTGLQFWLSALQAGASPKDVALGFTASLERLRNRVADTYFTLLGRAPDDFGLGYWVAVFQQGGTTEDINSGFVGSVEYYTKPGGAAGNPARWVREAYLDTLFRPARVDELAYWVDVLKL